MTATSARSLQKLFAVAFCGAILAPAVAVPAAERKSPLDKARENLLNLHNKERKKKKLEPLMMDEQLAEAAQEYAEFMAETGKFGHDKKGTPEERIRAAGFKPRAGGENIAWGLPTVTRVFREWMKSEEHRDNILGEHLTHVGFGVARGKKGYYWVANFGTPEESEKEKSKSKQPADNGEQ